MADVQRRQNRSRTNSDLQTGSANSTIRMMDTSNLERQMASGKLLRMGSSGMEVTELQKLLQVTPTGKFDEATYDAVVDFQNRYKLGIDGIVGGATFQTLFGLKSAGDANGILFELGTAGASATTARQDGLREGGEMASQAMAQTDWNRVSQYEALFLTAAAEYEVPPALLMAIASRETRGGNSLNEDGFSKYDGQGFGMMQVDKNFHSPEGGAFSIEHVRQAASILKGMLDQVGDKFPDWSDAQKLQGAVAAYNKGSGRVRSWGGVDRNTTGGDYSSDVWVRARYFAVKMGEKLKVENQ
ncbi:MAG: transglycosylase SLT domain-containing protein [Proteobacteria bacterium]|nr:transglycosylase SLT domain-containing protein [Pseudomonadota bacterium]MCP4922194.1 transglycosylase SLT domain-containing protein [Pseudomonadota bacterium]